MNLIVGSFLRALVSHTQDYSRPRSRRYYDIKRAKRCSSRRGISLRFWIVRFALSSRAESICVLLPLFLRETLADRPDSSHIHAPRAFGFAAARAVTTPSELRLRHKSLRLHWASAPEATCISEFMRYLVVVPGVFEDKIPPAIIVEQHTFNRSVPWPLNPCAPARFRQSR
jgi:hypothetical protein